MNFKMSSAIWRPFYMGPGVYGLYSVSTRLWGRLDSRGPHPVLCCRFSHWLINRRDNIGSVSWGRYKIAAISQTTFSNAFSWMKMYWFRFKISLKFIHKGAVKVMLHWKSTSVYTSWTYSSYHLELALGTFMLHFVSACLVWHTSWEKYP